jgi:hypothetical protein
MRAALLALIPASLLAASCIEKAHATSLAPVDPGFLSSTAAVGPGFVDSFTISCATTATAITPPTTGAMLSYSCQTPAAAESGGTTLVAVGDSGIADPDIGTRNSPVYSGSTTREFGGNARAEYCRADSGTVTIYCRAIVGVTSAP